MKFFDRNHNNLVAIGRAVRYYRELREWSQDILGMKAGVDRSYLSEIENAKRDLSTSVLIRIAEALNVSAGHIIIGEIRENPEEYRKVEGTDDGVLKE